MYWKRYLAAVILIAAALSIISQGPEMRGLKTCYAVPVTYPVQVTIKYDGVVENLYFANHSSDLEGGNWIALSGGRVVELPAPINLTYEGVGSATYVRDGRTITVTSTFTSKTITYPLGEHRVYFEGDEVSGVFLGESGMGGLEVDVSLVRASPLHLRDVLNSAFKGDLDPLKDLIGDPVWREKVLLNDTGDAPFSFTAPSPGDYALIVLRESEDVNPYDLWIYSATLVEVLDYDLDVSFTKSVVKGEAIDLVAQLVGAPTTGYRYGAVIIHEDSYQGALRLVSDGTVPGTSLTGNGVVLIEGTTDRVFKILGVGLNNVDKDVIGDSIVSAVGADRASVAFTDLTSATEASLSLMTEDLVAGRYILLVGVWELGTGNRIVGFYQDEVIVAPPPTPAISVKVTHDDVIERVLFIDHTEDPRDGNWVKLSGGDEVEIPELEFSYDGVITATYTRDGRTIEVEAAFNVPRTLSYPFTEHRLYGVNEEVWAVFLGMESLAGESLEVRVIKTSPLELRDVLNDAFKGNLEPLKTLIQNPYWFTTKPLNATGDCLVEFTPTEPGDYILLVLWEKSLDDYYELRIYGGTFIEVLDYDIDVTAPSSVTRGIPIDIDISLVGAEPSDTGYRYGAAIIHGDAYSGNIELTSDGTVPGTSLTGNGVVLIGGTAERIFKVAGVGLANIDKDIIAEDLRSAVGDYRVSVGYSDVTAETEASLSLSTEGLWSGDYILLVGVWELGSGRRIVAFYQGSVTITVPPPPPPPPPPPTPEEVEVLPVEEAVERLEVLPVENITEILEEVSPERGAEIFEVMDLELVVNVTELMDVEVAAEVLEMVELERAANVTGLMDVERAADVMDRVEPEIAANITEAGIELGLITRFANITLVMNRTRAAEMTLEVDVEDAAELLEVMVEVDVEGAAEVTEEAFEVDPLGTVDRLVEMDTEPLMELLLAILGLPSTPQTVAKILELLSLEKAMEVVRLMMEEDRLPELGEIFHYLATERLNEIFGEFTMEERMELMPYLTAETVARILTELMPLPDLTPISIEVKPPELVVGETCTITIAVKNIGNVESPPTHIRLEIDGVIRTLPVGALGVDETTSVMVTWRPEEPDRYEITALVDPENVIEELNEENNIIKTTVEVRPKPLPDLTVEFITVPERPEAKKEYTVEVLVRNIGEADAEGFSSMLKVDEVLVDTVYIERLAAGGETTATFRWRPEKAGDYTLTATVDPENVIVEENEANNVATTTVKVVPPLIERMRPWIIAGIVIAIIIAAIAVYVTRRR